MKEKQEVAVPAGYVRDARGGFVPEGMVKPVDQLRDQTVLKIAERAKSLSKALAAFKSEAFADVEAFVEVSIEQYDVRPRGKKGNITLTTFDGRYKVTRQIAEHIRFDERLQAARELVDECLLEWTAGTDDRIKALVNEAFQVDKEGRVNTSRVLQLRRLRINDPKWLRAMNAIADSIRITGTKSYIRIYEQVGDCAEYHAIVLDIAAL